VFFPGWESCYATAPIHRVIRCDRHENIADRASGCFDVEGDDVGEVEFVAGCDRFPVAFHQRRAVHAGRVLAERDRVELAVLADEPDVLAVDANRLVLRTACLGQ